MKRIVLIAGAVALSGSTAWGGLWLTGRAELGDRIGGEIARLEARGFEVAHAGRRIGGFPLGYTVTYADLSVTDAASGIEYLFPWLSGEATVGDDGRVTFRFPERFTATIPLPEPPADAPEGIPAEVAVDVEADDLVVVTGPPEAETVAFDVSADALTAITSDEEAGFALMLALEGLDATLAMPRDPEAGTARGRAQVARLDYRIATDPEEGPETIVEGATEDLSVSGHTSLRTPEAWQALFASAEAPGRAEFAYQAGESVSEIRTDGAGAPMPGTIRQSAGSSGGLVRLGEGELEFRASSENNRYEIEPAVAEAPVAGSVGLDSFELVYRAPIAPADELAPFELRLALVGIEGGERLWQSVDPEGALARSPASLVLEVAGTGRLRPPEPDGARTELPLDLGAIEIVSARLEALGASLTADGTVTFPGPANLPEGTITLRGENLLEALGDLQAAGILDEGMHQVAMMMVALYGRPGDTEDTLVTDIDFSLDGITVNGEPIQ